MLSLSGLANRLLDASPVNLFLVYLFGPQDYISRDSDEEEEKEGESKESDSEDDSAREAENWTLRSLMKELYDIDPTSRTQFIPYFGEGDRILDVKKDTNANRIRYEQLLAKLLSLLSYFFAPVDTCTQTPPTKMLPPLPMSIRVPHSLLCTL